MNKMFRHKNIFNLLFAVLLALPLINIAVRCIYVQSNKNAIDSYSGNENGTYQVTIINNLNDLEVGTKYSYYSNNNFYFENSIGGLENRVYIENYEPIQSSIPLPLDGVRSFSLYRIATDNYISYRFVMYDNSNNQLLNVTIYNTTLIYFDFIYNSNSLPVTDNFITQSSIIQSRTFIPNSTLDNAFEYSVNQFIEDNNFGNINFFEWFTSMFFTNNAKATTYVLFANWYMNYALLISLAYILFLVLMWFINFVRKLLDKGMSFGEGSY